MQIKKSESSADKHSSSDFDIFLFMAVVKEVVVYVVHESALSHLGAASAAMEAFLATRAGFLRRAVHRDARVPLRFMDIVEWNSLEEAEAAALAVEKEETVAAFMQAIASIEIMSHFCDA
jgi:hypothetical protein